MLFKVIGGRDAKELQGKFFEWLGVSEKERGWFTPQFEGLPNVKECTENDFWWHRCQNGFKAELWCGHQINKQDFDGKADWATMLLFIADHDSLQRGGFGILWSYNQKKTRYFRWRACDHDFAVTESRNCYREYTCKKCGDTHSVDSSG